MKYVLEGGPFAGTTFEDLVGDFVFIPRFLGCGCTKSVKYKRLGDKYQHEPQADEDVCTYGRDVRVTP